MWQARMTAQGGTPSTPPFFRKKKQITWLKGYKLYQQAKLRPEDKASSFVNLCVTRQRLIGRLSFWFGVTVTAF